ncbi:hypothetical protein [Parasitella parasitica]|uniref:Tc1-like transposase DDE domain-containing protein n=1 Tax=Parasitella parasitica TaxID=35722 RepID=A0A0B7N8U9_9FUNG|nr:hypothetical protein [Parasitella parasitica]
MSVRFIHENGKGEAVDESGNEHFDMDLDTEAYTIDYITNFDEHLDFYEKAMTPGQAAKQLGVNRRTAYTWVKKDQENPSDILEPNNGKKVGRPSILNEEHKRHLVSFYDDNPSAVVDQAMNSLTNEAAFHINLKRSMAWPKKGTRAEVVVPETRARTTTNLGAISPFGVVNVQLRRPTIPSKKRRLGSNGLVVSGAGGTVTGHYINFIKSTLDVLDNHEEFKGHYIVMDNAPIHTSKEIERYITSRGYGCIYLPPYSPELKPIEQFWSVVKSKLKREKLLEKETISSRIKEACNSILFSDLRGFCHYSTTKFNDCLEKKHLQDTKGFCYLLIIKKWYLYHTNYESQIVWIGLEQAELEHLLAGSLFNEELPYNHTNENIQKCKERIEKWGNVEICYNTSPKEPIVVLKQRILGDPYTYRRYQESQQLSLVEVVGKRKRFESKTDAQLKHFLNEALCYEDPNNPKSYKIKSVATKEIFETITPYTSLFNQRTAQAFAKWCSIHSMIFIMFVGRNMQLFAKIQSIHYEIIGYVRKSPSDVDPETRLKLLQKMVDNLLDRSLVDKVYVSVSSPASSPFNERDLNKTGEIMEKLNHVTGNTSDILEYLQSIDHNRI